MLMRLSAALPLLAIALGGAGCRPSPSLEANRAGGEAAASKRPAVAPADTAFIEVSRFEERGFRAPDGHCRWQPIVVSLPAGTGVVHGGRIVSIDPKTCVRVRVEGYRKRRPPEPEFDPAMYGSTSAATVYVRSGRAPATRKPNAPPPPP
jgi:hypothetical protein